jgi:hypothetical protein
MIGFKAKINNLNFDLKYFIMCIFGFNHSFDNEEIFVQK